MDEKQKEEYKDLLDETKGLMEAFGVSRSEAFLLLIYDIILSERRNVG